MVCKIWRSNFQQHFLKNLMWPSFVSIQRKGSKHSQFLFPHRLELDVGRLAACLTKKLDGIFVRLLFLV